jgi:acyl carrier protein
LTNQDRLERVIVRLMGPQTETITPTTAFIDDLDMDSLDIVELVVDVEEAFAISIPDEVADKWRTVGDVLKYLNKPRAKAVAAGVDNVQPSSS